MDRGDRNLERLDQSHRNQCKDDQEDIQQHILPPLPSYADYVLLIVPYAPEMRDTIAYDMPASTRDSAANFYLMCSD
ncbi:MAG: hypothetical protein KGJ90_04565 [Patescibacteria group bacterium]|nr:hypothetical protein [Patescibacteria group bacterium]